jgi:hypothetical protein
MRVMNRNLARVLVDKVLVETDEDRQVVLWESAYRAIGVLRRRNRGEDGRIADELTKRLSTVVRTT